MATYTTTSGSVSQSAAVTISGSGTVVVGLIYSYSIVQPGSGASGYDSHGNIMAYQDSVNGNWSGMGYDSLNRLTSATEVPTSGSPQCFWWSYDSFGNRTAQSSGVATLQGSTPSCQSSAPTAIYSVAYQQGNNQIAQSPWTYDAAGDVATDDTNSYLYDDEGQVCAVAGQPLLPGWPLQLVQYIYDAEGHRVAKGTISTFSCDNSINPSTGLPNNGFTVTKEYVVDQNGEQVTEMDGSGNWLHTNVYAEGSLLATYDGDGLHFHITDWLGSRRVQTDDAGRVEATYQELPFGEMVPQNNTIFLGATEQHFTGKERDTESGNDYMFARYYNSATGRFLSPDWSAKDEPVPYAKLDNPQSAESVRLRQNNPLLRADPDGHQSVSDQAEAMIGEGEREAEDLRNQKPEFGGCTNCASQQQTPSWDPSQPLPNDPSGLGSDWTEDSRHRDPNGGRIFDNPNTGGKIEWNPAQPGKPGSRGKDHWHYTPPGGKRGTKHEEPGDQVQNPQFSMPKPDPATVRNSATATGAGAILIFIFWVARAALGSD